MIELWPNIAGSLLGLTAFYRYQKGIKFNWIDVVCLSVGCLLFFV